MTWVDTKVVARTDWADDLWTVRLDANTQAFSPGQFVNIGIEIGGAIVRRSYSLASAPGAPLELYIVKVAEGQLTSRLHELRAGDGLRVDDKPLGFFSLEHVPAADVLWLLATGTGLGPYMSMLRSGQLWPRFSRVVVVHGVRTSDYLGYRDELEQLSVSRALSYVPMLTRERHEEILYGRIPAGIASGVLEKAAGCEFLPDSAHVMLCGNPAMISDTITMLSARGLRKHRSRKPGHITTEKYW